MDTPTAKRLGKKVLYPGKGDIPEFPPGTKVYRFLYKLSYCF